MSRRKKTAPSIFARQLTALMKERGLSIAEASRIAGKAQSTIGDWCSGTSPDDFVAVQRLADHFNVGLSFLLTGQEDKRNASALPPIAAVFDEGDLLFDGFAKITIQRLVPKKGKREED